MARGLLRTNRDFRLFWTAYTVSLAGTAVSDLAVPLTALVVLDASPAEFAALVAAGRVPTVLLALFGGVVADRVRRRPILVAEELVAAAAMGSIPVAAAFDALTLAQLFAVAVVVRTAGAFGAPAFYAYVPTLTGRDRIGDGIADIRASEIGVGVVGGPLGGGLVALLTAPVAVVVDAVSYLAGAVLILLVRTPEVAPPRRAFDAPSVGRDIVVGLRAVVATPTLRTLTFLDAVSLFVYLGMAAAVYLPFLSLVVGLTAVEIGLVAGLAGLTGIAATRVVRRLRERVGLGRCLAAAAAAQTLAAGLLPLAPASVGGLLVVAVSAVLSALATVVLSVNLSTLRQLSTPPDLLGRVGATLRLLMGLGVVGGASLAGVLAASFGIRPVLWSVAAVTAALTAVIVASPLGRLDELPGDGGPGARAPSPP